MSECENSRFKLYADLIGFKRPTELFNRLITDTVLVRNDKLVALELVCCFETNLAKSKRHSISRYENIKTDCKNSKWAVGKIFVEVCLLGFVTKDLNRF